MLTEQKFIYEKIEKHIETLLREPGIERGDRFLTEREIARAFNTSNKPVRAAMQKFLDKGILEKIQGKGTFIRQPLGLPGQTGRIGIVLSQWLASLMNSSFYTSLFSGVEQAAQGAHKDLLIRSFVRSDGKSPRQSLDELYSQVDGLILLDLAAHMAGEVEEAIRDMGKPVVVINYEKELNRGDQVNGDGSDGVRQMMDLLVKEGHTRIGCVYHRGINSTELGPNFVRRIDAYRRACAAHGLDTDDSLVRELHYRGTDHPFADLYPGRKSSPPNRQDMDTFRELLDRPDRPTALLCADDESALYLYRLAKHMQVRIPEDIAVTGHDDIREAAMVQPGLTTVHVPLEEMGRRAVERLLEKESDDRSFEKIVLQEDITVRSSHKLIR